MTWTHLIIEAYCLYDFKTKKSLDGSIAKLPISGCKKMLDSACLGTGIKKCPYLAHCDVEFEERKCMIDAWLTENAKDE